MSNSSKRFREADPGKLPPEGGGGAGTEGGDKLEFAAGPKAPAVVINRGDSYFRQQYTDATWDDNFIQRIMPASSDGTKFVFYVPKLEGSQHQYLNNMVLFLRGRILGKNGLTPTDNSKIAVINGQALVGRLRMAANGTTIIDTPQHSYPLLAYVGNLLNASTDRKMGVLTREGYHEDVYHPSQGTHGSEWEVLHVNSGWFLRRETFGETYSSAGKTHFAYRLTKYANYNIPLHTEFRGTLPMVSRVGAVVEITMSEPGFYLQCERKEIADCLAKQYRFVVDSVHLKVPVKIMNASQALSLEKKLLSNPAEFDNIRTDLGKFLIPAGVRSFNTDQIKSFAVCPNRLIFFMMPDYQLDDPFGPSALKSVPYFEKKWSKEKINNEEVWVPPDVANRVYLSDAVLTINNQALHDINPSDPSMLVDEHFNVLYEVLGQDRGRGGATRISRQDFANGKFFLCYDLTKSGMGFMSGNVRQEVKQGATKISLRFSGPLPTNVYLFALAEYHSKVKVTSSRTVYYSFID